MKNIRWDLEKAEILQSDPTRGHISFEDCIDAIKNKGFLADIPNTAPGFTHQRLFILNIENYAYVVPYVENEEEIFLKTIYPSRRFTAHYLTDKDEDNEQ